MASPHARGELSWRVEREGTADGLGVWFDTDLAAGVGFSNAPGEPRTIYGQALFPLPRPVALVPGDRVEVEIEARLVGDECAWRWSTRIRGGEGGDESKLESAQSTVGSAPVSLARLRRREVGHRPSVGEAGSIDLFVLSSMDGETPLSEIARRLAGEFPGRFADPAEALHRVARLSQRYG